MHKAFEFALAIPWAMEPAWIETVLAIANREGEGPEAVAAKLGRPLANTQSVEMRDGVAVIPVVGPILRYANAFSAVSGATSVQILARDFAAAVDNPSVKAIVLSFDSPGGEVNGIHETAEMIRAARGKKPIVAYCGGACASAAYWLAAQADEIVADATAQLGSIGVYKAMRGKDESAKSIDIVSSQSPRKIADPTTEEGKADIQALVDAVAAVFVADVAKGRNVSPSTVLGKYGKGGTFIGAAAVDAGLADRLGSLEDTIAALSVRSTKQEKRMHSVATALGLAADATEDQIVAAARAAVTDRTDVLAATGESTVIKAVGVIESARAKAARLDEAEAKLAAAEAKIAKIEHSQLIASLRGEGKLTAHMEALASKMTLDQLREFAADAKPVEHLTAGAVDTPEPTPPSAVAAATYNGKRFSELTNAEAAHLYQTDRALFNAMREAEKTGKTEG